MKYIKDTTYLGDLNLPVTLHNALINALNLGSEPHTYGDALKVKDRDLLSQRGIGRRTVAKWTEFKANNPVKGSGDPIWPSPAAPAVAPVLTQDHAARIADAERKEIERLRTVLAETIRVRDTLKMDLTDLRKKYDRLIDSMSVAQLRTLGFEVEVYEG